jgi:hypothetical protein
VFAVVALHAVVGALCVELTPAQGPDADELRDALTVRAGEAGLDVVFTPRCEGPLVARIELGVTVWSVTLRHEASRTFGRTLDVRTGTRALWSEQVAFLTVSSATALLAGRTPVTLAPVAEPAPTSGPAAEPAASANSVAEASAPPEGAAPRVTLAAVLTAHGVVDTSVTRRPALGGGVGLGGLGRVGGWFGEVRIAFDTSAAERVDTPSASFQLTRATLVVPLLVGLERGPFSVGAAVSPGVEHVSRQTTVVTDGFEATPSRASWRFLVATGVSGRWWPWAHVGFGLDLGVRWRPGVQTFIVEEATVAAAPSVSPWASVVLLVRWPGR